MKAHDELLIPKLKLTEIQCHEARILLEGKIGRW